MKEADVENILAMTHIPLHATHWFPKVKILLFPLTHCTPPPHHHCYPHILTAPCELESELFSPRHKPTMQWVIHSCSLKCGFCRPGHAPVTLFIYPVVSAVICSSTDDRLSSFLLFSHVHLSEQAIELWGKICSVFLQASSELLILRFWHVIEDKKSPKNIQFV